MRTIRKRQYEHNFSFFDEPNMINSYWAGFIAADGYLNDERKCLRLLVAHKDKAILYRFKRAIGFTGPVCDDTYGMSYIQIYAADRLLYDLKKNFNITTKKSLTLKPPVLPKLLSLAFIAGYIDGDGWRTKSRNTPCIGFQGTKRVVNWICDYLNKHFPATSAVTEARKRKDSRCYQATIYGSRVNFLQYQVNLLDLPVLKRKWK
jgi:hypothetical protein